MRIVAGSARGRTLLGPKDAKRIRPTADRVRQTLFDVLGQWLDGQVVLDLYAGTGALALEALSRGAARAVMVDQDREAEGLCRANVERLGFGDRAEILMMPVARAMETLARRGERFDVVFADPPYAANALADTLLALANGLLSATGVVCFEHDRREVAPDQVGPFRRDDQRRFGDTLVSWYRS